MSSCAGCRTVEIKDQRWCGDKAQYGATCFTTNTGKKYEITKEDWDKQRFGMVCSKANNLVDLLDAIRKLCRETSNCTYSDVESAILDFQDGVDFYKRRAKDTGITQP